MTEIEVNNSELNAILNATVDAILTIDGDGKIRSVNNSAESLFGYDSQELIGHNVSMLMPEPWASEHDGYMKRYRDTGRKRIIGIGREVEGKRKDGSTFPMHLGVGEYSIEGQQFFTGIIHDISRRRDAEAALVRAQKMEAIGQLTGGIAHDFNNLLTVIIGNLELLDLRLGKDENRTLLQEAHEAAEMGAELTRRLLAFARRGILRPETVNINDLVEGVSGLLKRTLGGAISFETRLQRDLWNALVDPGQIENALLNLAVNARDAMADGGRVIVETVNSVIDDTYMAKEAGVAMGEYVRISISDTGKGMAKPVLEKAFDPFFTTKDIGHGTGLGLSMVYGFARQSGGHATIYSEPGIGTTVNIYLPRDDAGDAEAVAENATMRGANEIDPGHTGRGELILVVDDSEQVRNITHQRLEALNYRTVSAKDGNDALQALQENADIQAVFTDLVMPGGISGYELAGIVSRLYPDMPILMTSGYAEDLVHTKELSARSLNLLRKPYKLGELAAALHELMARNRP